MTKRTELLIWLALLVVTSIVIAMLVFVRQPMRPPRGVWVSDDPHIVIFQHRRYTSPFGSDGRQGYMIDGSGEKTYFFAEFFDGIMRLHDAQTFFEADVWHEPIMYGHWRRTGWWQLTLDVDGNITRFTRAADYESPNTLAWNPGLETLHGVWQTEDGRLLLNLEEVSLLRTSSFIYGFSSSPCFQGVYDQGGANIGLLIRGSFTPHMERFLIIISENGNLRGHSFGPGGGGRFMRADGVLDGDVIHLQINHDRLFTISGDWYFPNEFTLYRVSD